MKFAKGTDKVFTIMYTVISVLLILIFILSIVYAGDIMNNISKHTLINSNYSADDITAGYKAIGGIFYGGIISFTASIVLYVIAIYTAIFALPLIIITIFAYIGMALYKKTRNPKHIRRNLIVKLIYTSIWTILSLIMTINDIGFVVVFVSLAVVLSILFAAVYGMRDHEYFAEY